MGQWVSSGGEPGSKYLVHAHKFMLPSCGDSRMDMTLPDRPKILLISDTHFTQKDGDGYWSNVEQEQIWAELEKVIAAETPQFLFILGDIFHGVDDKTFDSAWGQTVIQRFGKLGLPTTIIGGNHDRKWMKSYGEMYEHNSPGVKIYDRLLIRLIVPSSRNVAWLTHDGGSCMWLQESDLDPFLLGLRGINHIPDPDILITGHIHGHIGRLMAEHRVACIGACKGAPFPYAIIEQEGESLTAKFKTGSA
ncbi:hypothetical protein Pelo_10576 [Pelomyxa schiedti]|nr:hypothetical protein Pelo_10576 [Pelomyxa schiedti]